VSQPETHTAYILHRRPYRETSLLVELFTEAAGRVGVVARGARKPRKGATPLEPFRPLHVSWAGRGELRSLRGAEPAGPPAALRGEALYLGFYVNELLLRLCPRFDPYPRAFGAYRETLAALAGGGRDRPLRAFEAGLLRELGVAPDWGRCARCGTAVVPEAAYAWEPEAGVVCGACTYGQRPYSGTAVLGLEAAGGELGPENRRQARDLMRAALAPHLGTRPLESRELLRALRRGEGG
jgi:DNA repair protein RecO (recombination protein O)